MGWGTRSQAGSWDEHLSGFSRDGGEEVSQPIEHSPGPWRQEYWRFEINQMVWCIADANGRTVVEGNPYGSEPLDGDAKLIAAAPTMYRILRVIIEGRPGLIEADAMSEAHKLIRELEGGPDAAT